MGQNKILVNIFSNWTNFIFAIGMAFYVSPIIVHSLGNENYGIWTLVVSVTGYFTVLDFGVNTAIVRYISKYTAQAEYEKARSVYSISFLLFAVIGFLLAVGAAIFALFFGKVFNITTLSTTYLYFVFFIVALNLAFGLVFSVLQGTLQALQQFFAINVISITISVLQNILIVIFLLNGFSLVAMAIIQICMSFLRYLSQFLLIKTNFNYLYFDYAICDKGMVKQLYNYSVYSFLIAIALKILFYTDSVVIGSFVSVADITYYAIPATLVDYLEKLVWAIVAVLIPVISSKEALGKTEGNKRLYLTGTRSTFFFSLPIIIVLFTAGNDFICLWMGDEYGDPCGKVLSILLLGYIFGLTQLVAQGILKGISKHRVLAYILCFEAIINLFISLLLVKPFGIYGVAVGTTIPLILCNLILIPWYTCRELKINFFTYIWKSYYLGTIMFVSLVIVYKLFNFQIDSYLYLFAYSAVMASLVWGIGFFYVVDAERRKTVFVQLRNKLHKR